MGNFFFQFSNPNIFPIVILQQVITNDSLDLDIWYRSGKRIILNILSGVGDLIDIDIR